MFARIIVRARVNVFICVSSSSFSSLVTSSLTSWWCEVAQDMITVNEGQKIDLSQNVTEFALVMYR